MVEHVKRQHQKYGSQTAHVTEVKDFEVHTGAGVSGKVGEAIVLVGNKRLMRACSIPVGPEVEDYISKNEQLARTCVLVAIDGKVAGAFAVSDPVKPDARRVITFLRLMRISSIMVTGDNLATAKAIAQEVGIDNVFAEVDPVGKADKIKELQVSSIDILVQCVIYLCMKCSSQ